MCALNQDLKKSYLGKPTSIPPLSIHQKLQRHAEKLATLKKCSIDVALALIINNGINSVGCELEVDPVSSNSSDLTARQNSVLQYLRNGLTVKEIALRLNVGEATIRTHIIRIRERMGCLDILKLRIPQ
jgi:hypothetical protein